MVTRGGDNCCITCLLRMEKRCGHMCSNMDTGGDTCRDCTKCTEYVVFKDNLQLRYPKVPDGLDADGGNWYLSSYHKGFYIWKLYNQNVYKGINYNTVMMTNQFTSSRNVADAIDMMDYHRCGYIPGEVILQRTGQDVISYGLFFRADGTIPEYHPGEPAYPDDSEFEPEPEPEEEPEPEDEYYDEDNDEVDDEDLPPNV